MLLHLNGGDSGGVDGNANKAQFYIKPQPMTMFVLTALMGGSGFE
jgi:hypothetical protein